MHPLALDGLFGWALLSAAAGARRLRVVARAAQPRGDTRALLVPALAVAPFVLTDLLVASAARCAALNQALIVALILYGVAVRCACWARRTVRCAPRPCSSLLVLVLAAPGDGVLNFAASVVAGSGAGPGRG